MEQRPPLAWNVQALHKALGLAARDVGLRGLCRQRLRRITLDRRAGRSMKIRSHRATVEESEESEGENGSRAVSYGCWHLCYTGSWGPANDVSSGWCRLRENISIRTGRMISIRTG